MIFDVAVVGLGAMGSATVLHLVRRGVRVIGFERFQPAHPHGSSHGRTRIIRLGYFEHPAYVPLLRRAYTLWRELEALSDRALMRITGIAEIGPADGRLVTGTLAAARTHDLPHEVLGAAQLMRCFPAFRLTADSTAVFQPDGGFLHAEGGVLAQIEVARAAGADLRAEEIVRAVEPRGNRVRVVTDRDGLETDIAIVAAGPWTTKLLPHLALPLRVTRQVVAWFEPTGPADFAPENFPVFMIETARGIHYGFPLDGVGVKFAKHHHADEAVDPDTCEGNVSAADLDLIRPVLAEHLPAANGRLLEAATCLYTMTPDGHFLIDRVPDAPQILIASACSGHGFKFAPVIGEILADLVVDGATGHDISRFRMTRFG